MTVQEHETSFALKQSPLTSLYQLTVTTAILLLQCCSIASYSMEYLCGLPVMPHLHILFKGYTLILAINHLQLVPIHKYISFLVQTSYHRTRHASVAKAHRAHYQQLSTLATQLCSTLELPGQIQRLTCNTPAFANAFCRELHCPTPYTENCCSLHSPFRKDSSHNYLPYTESMNIKEEMYRLISAGRWTLESVFLPVNTAGI